MLSMAIYSNYMYIFSHYRAAWEFLNELEYALLQYVLVKSSM